MFIGKAGVDVDGKERRLFLKLYADNIDAPG
jgi:hypothetical protein